MTTSNLGPTALRANIDRLNDRDRAFATSLLASLDRYGSLTSKQAHWLGILAQRATGQEPQAAPAVSVDIGGLDRILAIFARAKTHLAYPAIVLAVEGMDPIRLNVAGPRAKAPGTINVTTTERDADGKRGWYGRIKLDGVYEGGNRLPTPRALIVALREFAADPAAYARKSAALTGNCCFCNRSLTDERSTLAGYGPNCAEHFGMPWGERRSLIAEAAGATPASGPSKGREAGRPVSAPVKAEAPAAGRRRSRRADAAAMLAAEAGDDRKGASGSLVALASRIAAA